jgi:peptidoglycan/LPS O-acetylase OafA/YrhL
MPGAAPSAASAAAIPPLTPTFSTWLDLCRVLAALAVYVGHSVALEVAPEALTRTWHRSADDAVIAFFVISGLVIAHSTRARHGSAADYALARASRIYSAAIPALLLALALDQIGLRLNASVYEGYAWQYPHALLVPPYHWLFLGEGWLGSWQPFSVEPYWSLSYEAWYYLLFGVAIFVRGWLRWPLLLLVLLAMGPAVLMLLPVWWLGVWLSRRLPNWRLPRVMALALLPLCVLAYALFLLGGYRDGLDQASLTLYAAIADGAPFDFKPGSTVHLLPDLVVALLFALFLLGCAHAGGRFPAPLARAIRWLADRSFSFYLIHFSLLVLARASGLWRPGWAGYAALLAGVLVVTWALGQIGEQRRDLYRAALAGLGRWLLTALQRSRSLWRLRQSDRS